MKLINFVKTRIPYLVPILKPSWSVLKKTKKEIKCRVKSKEEIFTDIYQKRGWGGESRSGGGSGFEETIKIREELPKLFQKLGITSLLDIPCGDFYWLQHVNLNFLDYNGADIVKDVILENNKNYANDSRRFVQLDITKDPLPKVDLILCRDLFQHLSFKDIRMSIQNIKKSGSNYLLTSSALDTKENENCLTGLGRQLNLLQPPFSFPTPQKIIHEKSPHLKEKDKALLLWKIEDL